MTGTNVVLTVICMFQSWKNCKIRNNLDLLEDFANWVVSFFFFLGIMSVGSWIIFWAIERPIHCRCLCSTDECEYTYTSKWDIDDSSKFISANWACFGGEKTSTSSSTQKRESSSFSSCKATGAHWWGKLRTKLPYNSCLNLCSNAM